MNNFLLVLLGQANLLLEAGARRLRNSEASGLNLGTKMADLVLAKDGDQEEEEEEEEEDEEETEKPPSVKKRRSKLCSVL